VTLDEAFAGAQKSIEDSHAIYSGCALSFSPFANMRRWAGFLANQGYKNRGQKALDNSITF